MASQVSGVLALCLSVVAAAVMYVLYRRRREAYLLSGLITWVLLASYHGLQMLDLAGRHPAMRATYGMLVIWAAVSLVAMAHPAPSRAVLDVRFLLAGLAGSAWSWLHAYQVHPYARLLPPAAIGSALFFCAAVLFWRQSRRKDTLGPRLLALASILFGGILAVGSVPAAGEALLTAGHISSGYGLLLLAVAMVVVIYEETQRVIEEDLLGLAGLNLTTSGYQAAQNLHGILEQLLAGVLKVCGVKQGIIALGGAERQADQHLMLGFAAEVAREWERRQMDRMAIALVSRMGGLLVLRSLETPGTAGRLESDPAYREFSEVMRQAGIKAMTAIGLQTKRGCYGALMLAHPPHRAFSAAELRLLATLGGQIGMAVENFLLVQDSCRRAEELNLLNQIGRALNSTLNTDNLLHLIHQEVQKLMDAKNFYIALWDEPQQEIRFELEVENGLYLPKRKRKAQQGMTEHILRTREPILVKSRIAEFRESHGIELSGRPARSWLGVPLLLYDRAMGVMAVQNYEREGAYDEGHLEIMQTLAAQAATALENARLFSEEQRRLGQLTFLNNITRIAISTLNADEMLAEIAREIQKNFAYDHFGVGLLDYQTKEIEIKAEAGLHAQTVGRRIPLDVGLIGKAARTGEMILVRDLLQEKPLQPVLTNARSALCIPIIYASQTLGVLNVESVQEAAFREEDVMILRTLADHLATALNNAFVFQTTQQQAITDSLTGLKTRRFFMESLQGEWKRATRSGRVFSLVLLDLDRFKQLNDTMGHLEGDLVLARLGKILEQRCRQSNVVARYGGDEFMILMPEAGTDKAEILAERLRLWIATDPVFSDRRLTASFGLATYPIHGDSPEDIIGASDAGLYLAKHRGGNVVGVAEHFRRMGGGRRGGQALGDYLEKLSRRLTFTGPDVFEDVLERVDKVRPSFGEDRVELEAGAIDGLALVAEGVERRVYESSGRQQAVAKYAVRIAAMLGLSERDQEDIRQAARLRDIGILAVPPGLLERPGKLDAAEFTAVKQHAESGASLLKAAGIQPHIVAMVRHHHEFFNGSGYPSGLAGQDIPLGARIIAVSDAFHALTSPRPWRGPKTVEQTVEEMERFAGTQFDPVVVQALLSLVRSEEGEVRVEN
jgi:diguanylate cyclase (GGDEF)-like protein